MDFLTHEKKEEGRNGVFKLATNHEYLIFTILDIDIVGVYPLNECSFSILIPTSSY